jgi:hypothetical protein
MERGTRRRELSLGVDAPTRARGALLLPAAALNCAAEVEPLLLQRVFVCVARRGAAHHSAPQAARG